MLCLRPQDIINCARVCHALRTAAYSEQLWQIICERQFADTAPRSWLPHPAENVVRESSGAFDELITPSVISQTSTPNTYRYFFFCACARFVRHHQRQLQIELMPRYEHGAESRFARSSSDPELWSCQGAVSDAGYIRRGGRPLAQHRRGAGGFLLPISVGLRLR